MEFDEYGHRENPTILLLHGAGLLDTFAKQYVFSDCYHLVVPHLPGAGSAVDTPYEPISTVHAIADFVIGLNKRVFVIGHSLGAELALALASQCEPMIERAVFLSPWVCPRERTIKRYVRLSGLGAKLMQRPALVRMNARYWGLNREQTDYLIAYAKKITPEQSRRFYERRVLLTEQRRYPELAIPMLAICGSREEKDIRTSVKKLGEQNSRCKTMVLRGVGHDYPLRQAQRLNPILLNFLQQKDSVH